MSEKRVVVIDDNSDIAELVCAMAESLQMPCTIAADLAAILAALTPEPSLIVMDLKMPGISGTELMGKLAARGCKARIVLMSGVGVNALREAEAFGRSLGLEVVGSLAKPFRGAELRAMLTR